MPLRRGGFEHGEGGRLHRRVLAFEVDDIGDKKTLLEQILAARQIAYPLTGPLEPRIRAVEMDAITAHGHAGHGVEMRLQRITVKDELVEPLRVHPIALRLQSVRMFLPFRVLRVAGEGFGANHGFPIHVSHGCRQFDAAVSGAALPEFGHGNIDARAALHLIERTAAIWFGGRFQPVLPA